MAVTSDISAPAPWLRIAPLGAPVVPDVYIRVQKSLASTPAAGSLSRARAMMSS